MQEQLSAARVQVDSLQSDLANWEAAVAARDVELQNLQRALGKEDCAALAGSCPLER